MRDVEHSFIDGRWVPAGPCTIEVHDSTTGELMGRVPEGSGRDVDIAVAAARTAFGPWAATSVAERAAACEAIAEGLRLRLDEVTATITRETGTPWWLGRLVQGWLAYNDFQVAARTARDHPFERELGRGLVLAQPAGVVGAIAPWNYPLHQLAVKAAYAIAAGCTVVLKPSEVAPFDALVLAEVIEASGLPPGVCNVVFGSGPTVGAALAAHPGLDVVTFTGSTAVGRSVARAAAQNLVRTELELGGKSANVLVDDLDDEAFEAAVRSGVAAAFLNSGQTCNALTRMLVPAHRLRLAEEIAADEALTTWAPGDPFADGTYLGPLASRAQVDRVRRYVEVGRGEGARAVTGTPTLPAGLHPGGYFVSPVVFSRVDPAMRIAQEEIFGPVLCLLGYDTIDEAVQIADATPYGLSGGVAATDADVALAVARRLRTGQVSVNGGGYDGEAPFGGVKQSGYGREQGSRGLETFLELKSILR